MKPSMAIKPLVFALAAVMAVAVQAGESGGNKDKEHHHDHDPSPLLSLLVNAGAAASVMDSQNSHNNTVLNQGTTNSASVNSSGGNANGNLGINVAGGDANQQDNAAAIATADESFIFGSAVSATSATQTNNNNAVGNFSSTATASLNGSANSSSGNIGVNVTAGDFNQQKNNLAIAVSGGRVASASAAANQTSNNTTVANYGTQTYKTTTLKSTVDLKGSYKGKGQGFVEDKDAHSGWGDSYGSRGDDKNHTQKDPLSFTESGTVELSGMVTYQVMTPDGWKNPIVNNASMNNSLNSVSGNVGANVAAGIGNQQSNSLSIAAGCKACM